MTDDQQGLGKLRLPWVTGLPEYLLCIPRKYSTRLDPITQGLILLDAMVRLLKTGWELSVFGLQNGDVRSPPAHFGWTSTAHHDIFAIVAHKMPLQAQLPLTCMPPV